DREERRREEDREELEEVLPPENLFTLRAEREEALVREEDLLFEHPVHDRVASFRAHAREGRARLQPSPEFISRDSALLEHESHELLGENVVGVGWRYDRFDVPARPQLDQPGSLDQARVVGGKEEAIPRCSGPPARPSHALEEARDRRRRID